VQALNSLARLALLSATVMLGTARSQSAGAMSETETVSLCEIIANPAKWNGKIVKFRAVLLDALRPLSPCPRSFFTGKKEWPQALYCDMTLSNDDREQMRMMRIATRFETLVLSEQFEKAGMVRGVFRGRIESRKKYFAGPVQGGGGQLIGNGYGHLNAFAAKVVVYDIDQVEFDEPNPPLPPLNKRTPVL